MEEAKTELSFTVSQLEMGDTVMYYDKGELKETLIDIIEDTGIYVEMYNIEYVKNFHNFFANGIFVHNKKI